MNRRKGALRFTRVNILCNFLTEIPKISPQKMVIGFFKLISSYAETTMLNDEKKSYIKRRLLHSPTKFLKKKVAKFFGKFLKFVLAEDFDFYEVKITFLAINQNIFSYIDFRKFYISKTLFGRVRGFFI